MPSGFGSVEGAKSTAVFSSFHETCKTHGVDLEDYLEFLFRYMGIHRDELKDKSLSDERRNAILEQGQCHGNLRRPKALTLDLILSF